MAKRNRESNGSATGLYDHGYFVAVSVVCGVSAAMIRMRGGEEADMLVFARIDSHDHRDGSLRRR